MPKACMLEAVVPPIVPLEMGSIVPPFMSASSLEPVADTLKSDAKGQDWRRRKTRRAAIDYVVASLPPSSSLKGDEQGLDVPEETKAAKTTKPFYSSIRKQGDSVESRFVVIYPYP